MTKNPTKPIDFAIDLHARILAPVRRLRRANHKPALLAAHALQLLNAILCVLN
jgi:hypothetical protein